METEGLKMKQEGGQGLAAPGLPGQGKMPECNQMHFCSMTTQTYGCSHTHNCASFMHIQAHTCLTCPHTTTHIHTNIYTHIHKHSRIPKAHLCTLMTYCHMYIQAHIYAHTNADAHSYRHTKKHTYTLSRMRFVSGAIYLHMHSHRPPLAHGSSHMPV